MSLMKKEATKWSIFSQFEITEGYISHPIIDRTHKGVLFKADIWHWAKNWSTSDIQKSAWHYTLYCQINTWNSYFKVNIRHCQKSELWTPDVLTPLCHNFITIATSVTKLGRLLCLPMVIDILRLVSNSKSVGLPNTSDITLFSIQFRLLLWEKGGRVNQKLTYSYYVVYTLWQKNNETR